MKSVKATIRMMSPQPQEQAIAPLIRDLLERLGEDPERDGLVRTPERVSEALRFLTGGSQMNIQKIVNGALYEVKYDEMVVVKNIEFLVYANTICCRSLAGCTWPTCRNRR